MTAANQSRSDSKAAVQPGLFKNQVVLLQKESSTKEFRTGSTFP
jgi:hypothetical protein